MEENYQNIDQLLVKFLLQEATESEAFEVKKWAMQNPVNQKYLHDFKLVWDESRKLSGSSSTDEDQAWDRFKKKISHQQQHQTVIWPINKNRYRVGVAAALLLVAGIAGIIYLLLNTSARKEEVIASKTKVLTDTLPDGSIAILNKNSSISYPGEFDGATRPVTLRGEAFFKVKPDKDKPFVIRVNDITVRVVGTSFNVRSIHGNTEVIVETGIVQVIQDKHAMTLHPKEKAFLHPADSMIRTERVTDHLYNYYRTKEFVCDNTPLWKLVEILNEAYDAQIVIENPSLRKLPLNATFYNESLDNIISIVSETFSIKVTRTAGKIILK